MKQLLEMQKQFAPDISEVIQYDPQQNLYYWTNPMGQQFIWLPSKLLAEGLILADHTWHHMSWRQKYYRLRRIYQFNKLRKLTRDLPKDCCFRCKTKRNPILNPTKTYDTPIAPFLCIHIDHFYVGPNDIFPEMNECLTVIDRTTGLMAAIPLPVLNFLNTWLALCNQKFSRHGLCQQLISENGSVFRSKQWTEHRQKLGIEHSFTLVANPACNGKIERVHRTMESILQSYEEPTKWPLFLPFVVLAINTHYEHSFCTTPAFRAYGFSILTPGILSFSPGDCERFTLFKRNITAKKEYLSSFWEKAIHVYVEILKKKHKLSPLFEDPIRF